MSDTLDDVLRRTKGWPESARNELLELAREIDSELSKGKYVASAGELAGIDRGIADAARGSVATASDVEAVFRKYRDA